MTFCILKSRSEQIIAIAGAEDFGIIAGEARRSGGPEMGQRRHQLGPRLGMVVQHRVMHLTVHAAVDRVDQAVALPAAGSLQKCGGENTLTPGVKTTSTGLSIPPVITGSIGPPSGRRRKICAAFVTNGERPGRS